MSTLPAEREDALPPDVNLPIGSVDDLARVAKMVAASGYWKDANTPQKAGAKMAMAMAMGFHPVVGMTGIDIIDGNPAPNGQLVAAAIDRHPDYDFRQIESTSERATVAFFRWDSRGGQWIERGRVTWTMEDARRAKLEGKSNWKNYPRAMLWWRAVAEGGRMHAPEALNGAKFYVEGELPEDDRPPSPAPAVNAQTGEVLDPDPLSAVADQALAQGRAQWRGDPDDERPSAPPEGQETMDVD